MKTLSTTKKLAGLFIALMALLLSCTLVGCSGGGGSYDEQSGVITSKMDWDSGFTASKDGNWQYKEADGKVYIKRTSDNFAISVRDASNPEVVDDGSKRYPETEFVFDVNGEQAGLTLNNQTADSA